GAAHRLHQLAFLREALARCQVELVLVLEAAKEPAASTADLCRIERESLVLGEAQVDGPRFGEPGAAAEFAAAATDAAEPGRLVAPADLPHLDPGAIPGGEFAHQRAEVDPPFRGEIDREPVPIPLPFGVGDPHLQPGLGGPRCDVTAHRILLD